MKKGAKAPPKLQINEYRKIPRRETDAGKSKCLGRLHDGIPSSWKKRLFRKIGAL
jgi:hypothetical protein